MSARIHTFDQEYSLKEITSYTEFLELRPDWNQLVAKDASYKPFISFDWFQLWLNHFLQDNQLLILALFHQQRLVFIAPLLLRVDKYASIPIKKIEFIGNVYSPVKSFISGDSTLNLKEFYLFNIIRYFYNNATDWDVIDLYPLSEHEQNVNVLLKVIKKAGCQNRYQPYSTSFFSRTLASTGDDYINTRSAATRQNLRRRKRGLEKLGDLEFRMIASPKNIDQYIEYYYQVYARSWKKREEVGPTFHGDLAKLAADKGWLRLGMLFFDNIPIAAEFCILSDSAAVFLKIAYDEGFRKYGPGNIVMSETIKHMIDNDSITKIDLGLGDEAYKRSWVDQEREMSRLMLFNNNFKGRLLSVLLNKAAPHYRQFKRLFSH